MDDIRLLELLESNARLSDSEIAAILGVSEKKAGERIKKLKKDGVLKGFRAVVDWKKAGSPKATAVIQVKVVPQQKTGFDKVCMEISRDKRVSDIFIMSGKYDLMVMVHADDIDGISEFVTERLAPMKSVTGTYTHVILKEFKRDGALLHDSVKKRLPVS